MKYILYLLLLILPIRLIAQEGLAFTVVQDLKLAFTEDDHGNEPFTLDAKFKFTMQGKQFPVGWLEISAIYEYAELATNYKRYAVGIGFNFCYLEVFKIPFSITPELNWGWIDRGGTSHSAELSLELSVKLFKSLHFVVMPSLTNRTDLDTSIWRANLMVGIKYTYSLL